MPSSWGIGLADIVQGVVIGITVSIVLALVDIWKGHRKRQKQVRYLCDVIIRQRQKIESVGDAENPPTITISEKLVPKRDDCLRQSFCRGLYNDLFLIMEGRDSVISDVEKVQIAKLFEPFRSIDGREGIVEEGYYKRLFEGLEETSWLNIKRPR